MKRIIVVAVMMLAHVASAGPRSVLVLRSEGTADATSRTAIDAQVVRLAKNIEAKVDAGDITLTEAAALVGCNPSDLACKDEVLGTLGVDEMIATTVTATPTGLNVTVRRIAKGVPPKAAQTAIPTGKPADVKMDLDIGPLFGIGLSTSPLAGATPATTTPPPPPIEPTTTTTTTAPTETTTTETPPAPPVAPTTTAPKAPTVTAAPMGSVTRTHADTAPRRTWQKIGMGVGGGLVVLGIVMWAQASGVQGDIDDRPDPLTAGDFQALKDLEKKGDDLAGGGNLMFLVGAAVTGVSAYYYVKAGKRARTQSARVTPTVFPHGAGVALTFGGAP